MQDALNQILDLGFGESFKRDDIINALKACSCDVEETIEMLFATQQNESETVTSCFANQYLHCILSSKNFFTSDGLSPLRPL